MIDKGGRLFIIDKKQQNFMSERMSVALVQVVVGEEQKPN